jgi:hypothetical protein
MTKRTYILIATAGVLILAALIYAKPWQSSTSTPKLSPDTVQVDQTQIVTSPKSGKKHPLSDFKPAPGQPGWVICPDTGQKLPINSLKH